MGEMSKPLHARVRNQANTPGPRTSPPRVPRTPRVDLNSAGYKQAASKYTRFMIAMPILLVTTYILFDRLALGHTKSLRGTPADKTNKV
ncbi:hypothetical protein F4808DRAFT_256586 [Astrocystis sublimbata]|nr:hypothetical protein F4808DRAFT_256586 [Astrocystis sublimbata]